MSQAQYLSTLNERANIAPQNQYNVLIVDDSEDDTFLLLREIKRHGLRVSHQRVDSDETLLKALKDRDWHIVISDHNMPCYSSTEALATVKNFDPDLPVIIVSGEIGEEAAVQAMKEGAHDYVMKDNLARLIPAIEREIRESASRHAKRAAEQSLAHLAYHDNLTGLANRSQFEERLSKAIELTRSQDRAYILMYLDLDQFKIINNTCGHIAGDELIRQLSVLLSQQVRNSDLLARLGGDEFAILLESGEQQHAMQLSKRIRDEIKDYRFIWDGRPFSVTISIGIVPVSKVSESPQAVMSAADIACYAAKERGRDNATWFAEGDKQFDQLRSEMHWATKIKQAIEDDCFFLCKQDMLDLDNDEQGVQCEFLVRLLDEGKSVPPGLFIPAAERYNMMSSIDRWVVRNVFKYLDETGRGREDKGIYFINLSGNSLSDGDFFNDIRHYLKEYKILPDRICFEITETAAIAKLSDAVDFIRECREEGFKFALDDFGVGLSSFSYLKTIPVDYLKIDGSFVKNMLREPIDQGIVKACNEIGHAASLKTIAEFVEDDETLQLLKTMGIDYAQGFGIDVPKPL